MHMTIDFKCTLRISLLRAAQNYARISSLQLGLFPNMHAPDTRQDTLKIGLIIGSTRAQRFADVPARWIMDGAAVSWPDIQLDALDLRDFPLPFVGEPAATPAPAASEAWRAAVAACDGYIITAAEYNHGPTAVLKNALDSASREWYQKPVAFVGYGGVGGARAVEQLRQIVVELQMVPIKAAIHIGGEVFLGARDGRSLSSYAHLDQIRATMLDQLVWWARALRSARSASVSAPLAAA